MIHNDPTKRLSVWCDGMREKIDGMICTVSYCDAQILNEE